MSKDELPVSALTPIDDRRYREGRTVTWVSVGVNALLTIVQIAVGVIAHAQSLVADGFHSLSDLIADFMVLVANYHSRHPADASHPYGHHRIETAASLALGLLLVATGGGILWAAAGRVQHLEELPPVAPIALWVAVGTLLAKEGLFRYMLRVGERLRSPMLIANAWHARSDAASSLVVTAGIAGSLLGYRFLDPVAAVIVGFMILRMGAEFAWDALRELMDEGVSDAEVAAIRATVRTTPGVLGLHDVRTRRMAQKVMIDAHIQVDGHISVSEGHRIGDVVRQRVLDAHEDVLDMLVHIDPEDDVRTGPATQLPDRQTIQAQVCDLLDQAALPQPLKLHLHYLGGQVELEIFLDAATLADSSQMRAMEHAVSVCLAAKPQLGSVTVSWMNAPK